jgi:hypothetical protein
METAARPPVLCNEANDLRRCCEMAQTLALAPGSATAVHRMPYLVSDRGTNTRSEIGLGKGAEMRRNLECNVRADVTQGSSGV